MYLNYAIHSKAGSFDIGRFSCNNTVRLHNTVENRQVVLYQLSYNISKIFGSGF